MKRWLFLLLCMVLAASFGALGVWQVQRLQWKEDLIARVNARLAAAPVRPPSPAEWSPEEVYTRVVARGVFQHDRETLVQAVTEHGPGWWVLTPLRTDAGAVILVNRGYVPPGRRDPATRAWGQVEGEVTVQGLLRASEPGGAFLRENAPAGGRWYSRDVQAIADDRRLKGVPPYFIDANAAPNPGGFPIGGLTTIRFRNDHLVYALTWFCLCALSLVGALLVFRRGRRT